MVCPVEQLKALAGCVPPFALSVACFDEDAEIIASAATKHGATFTTSAHDVAPSPTALHDCILVGQQAEVILGNEEELSDIIDRLSTTGFMIAIFPATYASVLSTKLAESLTKARLVLLRVIPVLDGENAAFVFTRDTYEPFAHAAHLAAAGMPGRAAMVLTWLEYCTPLSLRQRATVALEKLRYYRQRAEHARDTPAHGLLFHAQKEFHIAVHEWPRAAGPYLDQAAIWRRFGNDDYAARLLRSLFHATRDATLPGAIAGCAPERTVQPAVEIAPEWTGTKRAPRVLILTHDFSDYGMDTLYDGLCRVLGPEHIVEYPWKPTLHGRNKDAAVNYPCWFDYPGEPRTVEQLSAELREGEFDLIVFADFVQRNRREDIVRLLHAGANVPVAVYDPWDDGSASQDSARTYLGGREIAAYFKREMLACFDYGPNAYPLPFGYPDAHVPSEPQERRTTELFWAGKRLFGTRSLYLDYLGDMLGRSLDQTLTQEAYRHALAGARIGLSLFGFGFDTVRYWELAAHGCMVLAERPCVRIPFNFVEGESAVFFDDLPELEQKLAYYLSHPDEAERIGRAGRELFLKHHTSSARARQFLGRIEESIQR